MDKILTTQERAVLRYYEKKTKKGLENIAVIIIIDT